MLKLIPQPHNNYSPITMNKPLTRLPFSEHDINIIKSLFSTHSAKAIGNILQRSPASVNQKAFKLGIKKPKGHQRKNKIEILLDGSLQSTYWIGFLLADGHFHKRGNTLRLDVSVTDQHILEEFKSYVNSTANIGITKSPNKQNTCHLTCVNSDVVPILTNIFQINSTKTYTPPDFSQYNLTDEQWIALFIGLIDGDGYIQLVNNPNPQYSRIKIKIELYHTWKANLQFIKEKVYNYFNMSHRLTNVSINPNLNNTVYTTIACTNVIDGLYNFITMNNLFHMTRKWNKINQSVSYNYHLNTNSINNKILPAQSYPLM